MATEMNKTYNPSEIEDRLYKKWLDKKYFHAEVDRSKKPFTIVMPPPNITGQLHMGHALDNTLQDILIRFKRMQGYNALWQPGTDHASIATEVWLKTRNDSCANIDKNTRYLKGIVSDTTEISGNWDVIGKIYEGIISRINEEIENITFVGAHSSHSYLNGTNIYCRFIFQADKGVDYVQED